jgi:hypothetical protein
MIRRMEKGYIKLFKEEFMKGCLDKEKGVVKAFINLKMEINMTGFGKMINVMDKVNLLGTQEKLTKENGITI